VRGAGAAAVTVPAAVFYDVAPLSQFDLGAGAAASPQFALGFFDSSMTRTSTAPLVASSFSPSCVCRAALSEG
jgi:hypothetical protein